MPKLHLKSPELRQAQKQQLVTEEEIGMKNVHIVTDEEVNEIEVIVNEDTGEVIEEEIAKISRGGRKRKSKAEWGDRLWLKPKIC